jgi:uracil-DNA glycosylase family 4
MIKSNPHCDRCKLAESCKTVCDLGPRQKSNDVMVISETPRSRGDKGILAEALNRQGIQAYHASAVNCEPEKGKKPTDAQITSCKYYLRRAMLYARPKYVLLSGNAALTAITGEKGINKQRGKPFEKDGIIYLPAWTQNYVYFDPTKRSTFERDIRLFSDIIDSGGIPRAKGLKWTLVNSRAKLKKMLTLLHGEVAFDLETTGLFPWEENSRITALVLSVKKMNYVVPLYHWDSPWFDPRQIVRMIDRVVRRNKLKLITHNGKFDYLWMKVHFKLSWEKYAYFDTMLADYLLDENRRHGLKELAQDYLGAPDWDIDKEKKRGSAHMSVLGLYAAHDGHYTLRLKWFLQKRLNKDPVIKKLFNKLMMKLVPIFTEIEYNGVFIDAPLIKEAEKVLNEKIRQAELELKKFGDISWSSPQQVADQLFNVMKIPVVEATKTGKPSTSESVMQRIDHPVAGAILRLRGARQQLSFFIEGWKPYMVKGWLHPSFKLQGTVTGRLSCENPNLQQVPRDGFIRNLITAPPGWVFLEADLSQIELRIAAEMAGAKSLIRVFRAGEDAHWLTALTEIQRGGGKRKLVLATGKALAGKKVSYNKAIKVMLKAGPDACIDIEPAWKELRKKAKAVNFGYLFGMWWRKFKIYARDNYGVDVTDEQAQDSRKNFFGLYPEFDPWHSKQKRMARAQGYVQSFSGRKRRLPDAMANEDTPTRRRAERQSINSPVQSFANELNLMALVQMRKEFGKNKVKLCGTVHDSIIMIVREKYVEEVHNRILEVMRGPELMKAFGIKFKVPLEGEVKIGPWGKGVSLERWLSARNTRASTCSSRAKTRTSKRQRHTALAA